MKTFKFSLVLRTRENTDVFISLDDNIYGIHCKRKNILYVPQLQKTYLRTRAPCEDLDQPSHSRNLMRTFTGRKVDAKFLHTRKTLIKLRDAQADLSLCWTHMSEGTFSRMRPSQCKHG